MSVYELRLFSKIVDLADNRPFFHKIPYSSMKGYELFNFSYEPTCIFIKHFWIKTYYLMILLKKLDVCGAHDFFYIKIS